MIMPKAVTDLLGQTSLACLGSSCEISGVEFTGLDVLPDVTQLTSAIKLEQQSLDVSSLTPPYDDYELKLSLVCI